MQSIEQSTDVGEDVIQMKENYNDDVDLQPPGHSLIFDDLFGIKHSVKHVNQISCAEQQNWIHGPSQCLIYICKYQIFQIHFIILKFFLKLSIYMPF